MGITNVNAEVGLGGQLDITYDTDILIGVLLELKVNYGPTPAFGSSAFGGVKTDNGAAGVTAEVILSPGFPDPIHFEVTATDFFNPPQVSGPFVFPETTPSPPNSRFAPDYTLSPDFHQEEFNEALLINGENGRLNPIDQTSKPNGKISPAQKTNPRYTQPDSFLDNVDNRYKI